MAGVKENWGGRTLIATGAAYAADGD